MVAFNRETSIKLTLKHEGGYVNNPKDPGGETNYGITKATAAANGYHGSMRAIPMAVVIEIYRQKFWNAVRGDSLPMGFDFAVYDFGVNSGPARANKYAAGITGTAAQMVKTLCAKRLSFMRALGTWATFGKGWSRRVAEVEAQGVKMALQGEGKSPAVVKGTLQAETKEAAKVSKKDAAKAGGTVAAPSSTQVPDTPAHVDVSSVDPSTKAGIAVLVIVLLIVAGFFAWRCWTNRQRSQAYASAAKEVTP